MAEVTFVLNKTSGGYITPKEVERLNGIYHIMLDLETCSIITDLMKEDPCFIEELYEEMVSNGLTIDSQNEDDHDGDEDEDEKVALMTMVTETITLMDFDQIIIERVRSMTQNHVSYATLARIFHVCKILSVFDNNDHVFSYILDIFYIRSYIPDINECNPRKIRIELDAYIASKIEYGNNAKIDIFLMELLILNGNGIIRPTGSSRDTPWVYVPATKWATSIVRVPEMNLEEYEDYKIMEMYECLHHDVKKTLSRVIGSDIYFPHKFPLSVIHPKVFNTIVAHMEIDPLSYGMIVPLHMKDVTEQYILDNIDMYTGIITGDGIGIANASDGEIFANSMRYFYYTSRHDLIGKFRGTIPSLAFTPLSDSILDLSTNQVLTTLENLKEVLDECELIMVNIDDIFYTFDVDEAKNCWDANKSFVIPTNPSILIPNEVMKEVVNLCRCYDTEGYTSLRNCIEVNTRRSHDIDGQNDHIKSLVIKMEMTQREGVKNMLMEIFHAAMYLRGWDGTHGVFPLKTDQTRPEWDVQEKSTDSLITAREYCDKHIEIFNLLTCYEFSSGRFKIYPWCSSLMEYFDDVMKHKECIRVASSILCNSTAYYIEFLFGHIIDGYDHDIIDSIW
jgi:hypothetical protein